MLVEPALPPANGCWEWPRESPWHRTSIVLLLLSVIQIFTSFYIYFSDTLNNLFLAFYLAFAVIACFLMVFRVTYGLLWFSCGSLLYCVWICVNCFRAMGKREWVDMCLSFSLAMFEFLCICIAMGHFRELGGVTQVAQCCPACCTCCGPPDLSKWKAALLIGGGHDSSGRGGLPRARSAVGGAGGVRESVADAERQLEREEAERTGGRKYLARSHASYIPPSTSSIARLGNEGSNGSSSSPSDGDGGDSGGGGRGSGGGMFDSESSSGEASNESSASNSYNAEAIGRGYLQFPGQQPIQQAQQYFHPQRKAIIRGDSTFGSVMANTSASMVGGVSVSLSRTGYVLAHVPPPKHEIEQQQQQRPEEPSQTRPRQNSASSSIISSSNGHEHLLPSV